MIQDRQGPTDRSCDDPAMGSADPRYPLGVPLNRKPPPVPRPIEGRPNWFLDANDLPFYVEPGEPASPAQPAQEQTKPTQPGPL